MDCAVAFVLVPPVGAVAVLAALSGVLSGADTVVAVPPSTVEKDVPRSRTVVAAFVIRVVGTAAVIGAVGTAAVIGAVGTAAVIGALDTAAVAVEAKGTEGTCQITATLQPCALHSVHCIRQGWQVIIIHWPVGVAVAVVVVGGILMQ